MRFLQKMIGKNREKPKSSTINENKPKSKYSTEGGFLLPQYWRCLACQGRKQATITIRIGMFRYMIEDKQFLQSLNQSEIESMKSYYEYSTHPQGALLERPPDTEHLEDTTGFSRDRTGMGFDAVYLCEDHSNELSEAIQRATKQQ